MNRDQPVMRQGYPQPPNPPSRSRIGIKISLLVGLLSLAKIASMARRGAVGTELLRLMGIVIGEVLLLLVSVISVDLVFYVLLFYLPFSSMLPGDYGTAVNIVNVLIVICIFGLFCRSVKEGGHFFVRTELDRLIGVYLLLIFISFFRASLREVMDWFMLLTLVKRFCTPIILYYLASWLVRDRDGIKNSIFAIMVSTLMVAFLATKDTVTPTHFDWERRESGVINQANILAAFFAYYMFYFVSYAKMYRENLKAWLLLPCLYPCARGLMLTFSRGGYIAFAVTLLYVSYLWHRGACVLVAFCLLFVWVKPDLFLPQSAVERLRGTVVEVDAGYGMVERHIEESSQGRLSVWAAGLKVIMANPILGTGYGQFPLCVGQYDPGVGGMDAHNTYILIAAEMGIPALVVFIVITFKLFNLSLAIYHYHPDKLYAGLGMGYATGMVGFWVANFFGCRFNTTETISYFWILAALLTLIHRSSPPVVSAPGAGPMPQGLIERR
ncbi:MAG: O-antigen ligase family protein [Candidatus Aureabacteria bacterium]|nr:O-antigen ligase family protein [Candidatus Auribacterota bacterium]